MKTTNFVLPLATCKTQVQVEPRTYCKQGHFFLQTRILVATHQHESTTRN
jgi:hypothetical protein